MNVWVKGILKNIFSKLLNIFVRFYYVIFEFKRNKKKWYFLLFEIILKNEELI